MESRKILVDTSVLIDFLRKKNKEKSLLWELREEYSYVAISAISVFELFAGATDEQKVKDVEVLLKWLDIITFTEEIAKVCGELLIEMKKSNKLIEYRDLFIGASAIFHDLKLATLNIKHFDRIPQLEIIKKPY